MIILHNFGESLFVVTPMLGIRFATTVFSTTFGTHGIITTGCRLTMTMTMAIVMTATTMGGYMGMMMCMGDI